MRILEKALIVLTFLGIVMKFMVISGGDFIIMLSLFFLASLYFYLSVALLNGVRFRKLFKRESFKSIPTGEIIIPVLAGVSMGILLMGILFKLLYWVGAGEMLLIGLFLSILFTALCIYLKVRSGGSAYGSTLYRIVPFSLLGLLLFYTSSDQLLEIQYRQFPTYVEARKRSRANPDDENLRKLAELEYYRTVMSIEEFGVSEETEPPTEAVDSVDSD